MSICGVRELKKWNEIKSNCSKGLNSKLSQILLLQSKSVLGIKVRGRECARKRERESKGKRES